MPAVNGISVIILGSLRTGAPGPIPPTNPGIEAGLGMCALDFSGVMVQMATILMPMARSPDFSSTFLFTCTLPVRR